MDFIKDFFGFMKTRKKYWLFPAVFILMLFTALIVMTSGTAVAPFIYTIF